MGERNKIRSDAQQDLPEWLRDFRGNLVDDEASVSMNEARPVLPQISKRKHNVFTHFRKNPSCKVCKWTKITKALVQC